MVPPMVCVVGESGVGKTYVMERLIAEMKKRGYRVATVKHVHHRFEIDQEGKDTWKHARAGADAVVLSGPGRLAKIQSLDDGHDSTLAQLSRFIGLDFDIVLVEGFKREKAFKIEVHRKGFGDGLLCTREELLAVATDEPLQIDVPQFALEEAGGMADVIEKRFLRGEEEDTVALFVNSEPVPLSPFPRHFIAGTLLGMVSALKKVSKPHIVDISVRRKAGE